MSKQVQRLRAVKDDATNPTLFKVIQSQTFLEDETVLSHVDEFINNHPLNSISTSTNGLTSTTFDYTGINPTVLSQLNRLQRSLRGLPPLFEDESVSSSSSNAQISSTTTQDAPNKKIVFDD